MFLSYYFTGVKAQNVVVWKDFRVGGTIYGCFQLWVGKRKVKWSSWGRLYFCAAPRVSENQKVLRLPQGLGNMTPTEINWYIRLITIEMEEAFVWTVKYLTFSSVRTDILLKSADHFHPNHRIWFSFH